MPTDINFTSSGTTTNTATNTGWTCRPSNDGSLGTCSKNDNSARFNYVCSGKNADGNWSRCQVDTPVVGNRNEPGAASYYSSGSSNLGQSFTYQPFIPPVASHASAGNLSDTSRINRSEYTMAMMQQQSKPRELSPIDQEKTTIRSKIFNLNQKLGKGIFDGISPIIHDHTVEELKSTLEQKNSSLDKHRIEEQAAQQKFAEQQEKKSLEEQERSKTIMEIIDINRLRNKEPIDGIEPTDRDRSIAELKNILEQKRSLLEIQRNKELEAAEIKTREYSAEQQERKIKQELSAKSESDRIFSRKPAGPLSPLSFEDYEDYKVGRHIPGYDQIKGDSERLFQGPIGIRDLLSQHDGPQETIANMLSASDRYLKNSRTAALLSSMEEWHDNPTLDSKLDGLIDEFVESNPQHKKLIESIDRSTLKETLVKEVQNNQKKDSIGANIFNELLGIPSANANPAAVATIAPVVKEIITLGGTALVSAIVANKAIDDYSKYQELEDKFSKPKVLSTPIHEQQESTESFPAQEPLINPLPGFQGLSTGDKMPLAEEFPVTEVEYENLVSLKEGEHTTKSRLKDQQLPTEGKIRFVPEEDYKPTQQLKKGPNNGYYDRFDNEWKKGPSRTPGEPFEWDVQLSQKGKQQLGHLSRDGNHINVSLKGRITHK